MNRKIKIFLKYLLPAIVLLGAGFYFLNLRFRVSLVGPNISQNSPVPTPKPAGNIPGAVLPANNKNQTAENKKIAPAETTPAGALPAKIKISVPFTSQAPLGAWDQYHEEACEETALIMLEDYFNKKPLTPETAESQIQKMIAFEIKHDGDYKDTDAQQNVNLFNAFYGPPPGGKKLAVIYDFSEQDLKTWLAKGNPVIVPTAGRELGNPHYTPPGPLYHNLVLIGYDGNRIITNDPGTKYGAGYPYNIDILYKAIHDFTDEPEDIDQGRKAMLVVE
jgi:uncharacterized protein YvpB